MENNQVKILAIETSCDETAVAVIGVENEQLVILSNVVSSQIELHQITGGIVPEVAARAHIEAIIPVIKEALLQENLKSQIPNNKQITNSKSQTNPTMPTPESTTTDFIHRYSTDKTNPRTHPRGIKAYLAGENPDNPNGSISGVFPESNSAIQQYNSGISEMLSEITHVAVTAGPGLVGALLVGFNTAKTLAYSLGIPIIPVNHIEGHIYSALGGEIPNNKFQISNKNQIQNVQNHKSKNVCDLGFGAWDFPILCLTVSGGHTSLTLMRDHGVYENIGQTVDDAAGEAFDKVAKLLGLDYPGGPAVSKLAEQFRENIKSQMTNDKQNPKSKYQNQVSNKTIQQFNNSTIVFPRPMMDSGDFNFSFSGLKTAVLHEVRKLTTTHTPACRQAGKSIHPTTPRLRGAGRKGTDIPDSSQAQNDKSGDISIAQKQEIAWAFEEAVVDVLVTKTMRAAIRYKPKAVILAGGVAANMRLREEIALRLKTLDLGLLMPELKMCGDNAAMIGLAAYYHIIRGDTKEWNEISLDANAKL